MKYVKTYKIFESTELVNKGLTWMEEDVLKKTTGNEIEILNSLDPETDITLLKISFRKKMS